MEAVILSCSSLEGYVEAAQKKQRTAYPVILLDRKLHVEPRDMRERILEELGRLPETVDTVLVAMGFCGGSWSQVPVRRRTVIPRVDDCISLLLQRTDAYVPNLKEMGHMYMAETDPDDFDMERMLGELPEQYQGLEKEEILHMFFDAYHFLDVVDTGLNDCYSEEYVAKAQRNADFMDVTLDYVEGSNHLLEKLIGGQWDEQFLVAEPGQTICHGDFFE